MRRRPGTINEKLLRLIERKVCVAVLSSIPGGVEICAIKSSEINQKLRHGKNCCKSGLLSPAARHLDKREPPSLRNA